MNAPFRDIVGGELRRPLRPGAPICHWRIGRVSESRYDVPDAPMQGQMDPFFFLTKDRNFIPHEYPCRAQFAAERRGKRPVAGAESSPIRWWLPFGSPRVDLSGFWFRPTVVGAWAHTAIRAETDGKARFKLSTCGGAVLFVNGQQAGWLAPYVRNLEHAAEFDVALTAGSNAVAVYFDDLAERDTRFMFELDYLEGPDSAVALATPISADAASAVEEALDGMRFERPAYRSGEVRLLFARPLPLAASARIDVEGDVL
jgi:hypothetical protein